MLRLKFYLLLLAAYFNYVQLQQQSSSGTFTVVAPSTHRFGKPFRVSIYGHNLRKTITFKIQILATTNKAPDVFKFIEEAKISPFAPQKTVIVPVYTYGFQDYKLQVSNDLGYIETRNLKYITKYASYLIQTDKSIYFPDDLIRFRIFVIDTETKSLNPDEQVSVKFLDPNGFTIRTFTGLKFIKGKYQGDIQLSSRPGFGMWQIVVVSGNDISTKYVEVTGIETPTIFSQINIQDSLPISRGLLPVSINTLYTFTDDPSGIATILFARFGVEYFRKVVAVNSSTVNFDVNMQTDLKAVPGQNTNYDITLQFYDQLTGVNVTDYKAFMVRPQTYKILLSCDEFSQAGNSFSYTIVVQKYDGSPAPAWKNVTVVISSLNVLNILELDQNGSASSTTIIPNSFANSSLTVDVSTSDALPASCEVKVGILGNVEKTSSISINVDTISPNVNSPISVRISVSEVTARVICILSAKGVLLEAVTVALDRIFGYFTFTPTLAYVPVTNIICYYPKPNGRIVTAFKSIDLTSLLTKPLWITSEKPENQPGTNINIQVESNLYSTVSLFAVDQRISAMRDGNNVMMDEVVAEMMKYYGVISLTTAEKIPDYEVDFNKNGLFIFTDIIPGGDCIDYLVDVEPEIKVGPVKPVAIGPINTGSEFAKSILWKNVDIKNPIDRYSKIGREIVSEAASLTSANFILNGVSMSAFDGIRLSSKSSTFSIFRPFFISTEFPYSIKKTEILIQSIKIYNFLQASQTFDVIINKDPKYELYNHAVYGWSDNGNFYTQRLTSVVGQHLKLLFGIRAIASGTVNFVIVARGPLAGDTIYRVLKIDPLGVYTEISDSLLLTLTSPGSVSGSVQCTYPPTKQQVLDVSVSISGDILGRCIIGLREGLIRLPTGCGEQTASQLFILVLIWKYLKLTGALTKEFEKELRELCLAGYQNELDFLRIDGSFAWHAGPSARGETWVTSHVILVFCVAKDFIPIDMKIIQNALNFMSSVQNSYGIFGQYGSNVAARSTAGSIDKCSWIAIQITNIYCALKDFPTYWEMFFRSINYLERCWCETTSPFDTPKAYFIIAYALSIANSPVFPYVKAVADGGKVETSTEIYYSSIYGNIFASSFGLLIAIQTGDMATATKIAPFLIRMSNENGGFDDSYQTMYALYALTEYAVFMEQRKLKLELTPNFGPKIYREINSQNKMDVETIPLDTRVNKIDAIARADSNGVAVVTLKCGFIDDGSVPIPAYDISYRFITICAYKFTLEISFRFLPTDDNSKMTIVMVDLPSGWMYDSLVGYNEVQQVELQNKKETAIFYFTRLDNRQMTFTFTATKYRPVDGVTGRIKVIDYYRPTNEAFLSFTLTPSTQSCIQKKLFK